MTPDLLARSVWILLAILLVSSGLVARRLSWGKSAALIASWLAIILAVWALVLAAQTIL